MLPHVVYVNPYHLGYPISSMLPHVVYVNPYHQGYPISSMLPHVVYVTPYHLGYPISSILPHIVYITPYRLCHPISSLLPHISFRNNTNWLSTNNGCRFSCSVHNWGSISGVAGFAQSVCSSDLISANYLSFWCHYSSGDGAVLMIGGGGSSCARADHGIAITESDSPKFGDTFSRQDFGDESGSTPVTSYALNLWIR